MDHLKVIGFGEILLRLTSNKGVRIENTSSFKANYGGGEANVLLSLSRLGLQTSMVSKVSKDSLGLAVKKYLRGEGVDTTYLLEDPSYPLGLYFLEEGEGNRPSSVIYNRHYSAFAHVKREDYNWDEILKGATLFHLSGITLACSENSLAVALDALEACKRNHVLVSFDFNYRAKLLSLEKAKEIYPQVAPYCDIVSASKWDIQTLLGYESKERSEDILFEKACQHFNFQYLFSKKREIYSSREQSLKASCYTSNQKWSSKKISFEIFDRIGAGDSFMAGVLYAILTENDPELALNYGLANSILEQSTFGDAAFFTKKELDDFLLTFGKEEVRR